MAHSVLYISRHIITVPGVVSQIRLPLYPK